MPEKVIDGKTVALLTVKLRDPKATINAEEARKFTTASGLDTVDDQVDAAWAHVQKTVKEAVLGGRSVADISLAGQHNPAIQTEIEKRLTKAGFKYVIQGLVGYIYW
jgi:hypothetical protein